MHRRLCLWFLLWLPVVWLQAAEPTARPDIPPQPLTQAAPVYPPALKEQRIVGSANLLGVVDENGDVRNLVVDYASMEEFGQAAVAAVSQWKYVPATKAGQPCAVKVGIPVRFALTAADLAELDVRRVKATLPPGPAVHPVEEVDTWPELKKEIRPDTPERLKQQRQFGQAVMVFIVDEHGVPRDIHPLITSHAECVQAAAAVIEKWRFNPGLKDGRAVRTELEVTLVFFPESRHASGLRVRPGVRSGEGFERLPAEQQNALEAKRVGTHPKVVKQPPPEYPREMLARSREGNLTVEFIIDRKGRVTHVRSVGEPNPFFAAMAERACSWWEFQPATLDGQPAACFVSQRFEFGRKR